MIVSLHFSPRERYRIKIGLGDALQLKEKEVKIRGSFWQIWDAEQPRLHESNFGSWSTCFNSLNSCHVCLRITRPRTCVSVACETVCAFVILCAVFLRRWVCQHACTNRSTRDIMWTDSLPFACSHRGWTAGAASWMGYFLSSYEIGLRSLVTSRREWNGVRSVGSQCTQQNCRLCL